MIPNADEWTIIFSKNSTSWGAFTYNEAEDALRVSVKPQATEMHNALTYDFDQLQPDSAVVTLAWEKVAVPFKVGVDVHNVAGKPEEATARALAVHLGGLGRCGELSAHREGRPG